MNHNNPYAAPISETDITSLEHRGTSTALSYWLRLTVAIGISGAAFGIIGGPLGIMIGGLLACLVAGVVTLFILIVVALLRGNQLSRSGALICGAICGFLSGACSVLVLSGGRPLGAGSLALAAGLIGALGGVVGAATRPRSSARPRRFS